MARLFLTPGQTFDTIGGATVTDVFGTNSNETVFVSGNGKAVFDPSFNRGGDVIDIDGFASSYFGAVVGSNLVLTAANGASITIPFGNVGTQIVFNDGARTLVFNGTNVTLGGQVFAGSTPVSLTPSIGTPGDGITFNLVASTVPPGLDVMRLTGDQDVRIDFTRNADQITGLDVDGDGTIESNGIENKANITALDDGKDFEVVDAYLRNRTDLLDIKSNFLGDIDFDGTGNDGDGVGTNGNIVLGGLGSDQIFGGIGNDFITGGGVLPANLGGGGGDVLSGGRNADFFFAEFSTLSFTEGKGLTIDGGSTTDDSAVGNNTPQDSDWFLVEAQDDEEPYTINLNPESAQAVTSATGGSTAGAKFSEIENVDASGNLYGFLDNVDVALGEGGKKVNGENVGIGSSAQLAIIGSVANNIFVGGTDNDRIDGLDGNDILFGGNLRYNNNPNTPNIINDGGDELYGGVGDDSIVFEADGGVIEGNAVSKAQGGGAGGGNDTLYLTKYSTGTKTATDLTTDGVLRFDLQSQNIDNAAGYGGADSKGSTDGTTTGTQDQTNYKSSATRVDVRDMDGVIATGLGAIDYKAAGSNSAADLVFRNQQNQLGYSGKLDLRGDGGKNTLYATQGSFDDVIEGRGNDDLLSGGDGSDTFVFASLNGNAVLDAKNREGVDTIWRQQDNNGDNLWDTDATTGAFLYTKDFGQVGPVVSKNSQLTLTLDDLLRDDLVDFPVNGLTFKLDGTQYTVTLTNGVQSTYANFTSGLNAALDANATLAPLNAVLNGDQTITITDPNGRTFAPIGFTFVNNTVPANGNLKFSQVVGAPQTSQTSDIIQFVSYEDRADGEKVNDNAAQGSVISLGTDGYANDRVTSYGADGTRIAEDQSYLLTFNNVTTQDVITVNVNGVTYSITVGIDADGNAIPGEDSTNTPQADIQTAALARLATLITEFADDDIASGEITAVATTTTITLTQDNYAGDQTVFMTGPVVTLGNASGGQPATVSVQNTSDHEVYLFQFDGRNNALNAADVLFLGDSGISRAVLETGKNAGGALNGLNAQLIDDETDDVAASVANSTGEAIINNQAASGAALGSLYSVHGDDLLQGGTGNDTIKAGTGDDRVIGSLGTDTADGGKDYYRVQILGETQARVYLLNAYEASTLGTTVANIANITKVDQTETGLATVPGFTDVLQFQQFDFTPGTTTFTVNVLNNTGDFVYDTATGKFGLVKGGAGTVSTDNDANGVFDASTTFVEFENIRTVSGVGKGTAGSGQGNDTVILTTVSDTSITGPANSGGVSYDLTDRATAGQVNYGSVAHTNTARPLQADFANLLLTVDGVENVITGKGDDLVMVDETEAPKNNKFELGLGDDRVQYLNKFDTGAAAEPVVTIKVNPTVGGVESSTVTMTGARLGATVAVDTLSDVEIIALNKNTAEGLQEADVLDLTPFANGVIFNYADATIAPPASTVYGADGAPYGTVRDLGGNLQLVIEEAFEIENVYGDGNDTVIVGDVDVMGQNARADTASQDIAFSTFLDFDTLVAAGTNNARKAFSAQTTAEREDIRNPNEFTFSLSKVGSDADIDTVDYSQAADDISVVVEMDLAKDQFVLVDGAASVSVASGDFDDAGDRIDRLSSVERIVASQGASILDFTNSKSGTEIKFSAFDVTKQVAGLDRDVYSVLISDIATAVPNQRGFIEYRDAGLSGTINQPTAVWTGIEGGDAAERVILNSAHSFDNMTMNLRGGANEVKYNELTRSINLSLGLVEFDSKNPLTTGLIQGTVTFQNGNGVNAPGPLLAGSGTHTISGYTAGNGIASGSMRFAASQDAEDLLTLTGNTDKLIILAEQGTTDNQVTVKINEGTGSTVNSVILTGFEFIGDAATNDVYDVKSLANFIAGLKLQDNAANDHDTLKLQGTDGINFNGSGANTIDLDNLSAVAPGGLNFDFDVLDVTGITSTNLILNGGSNVAPIIDADTTDELVLGALNIIGTGKVDDFESVVFTQASVAASTTFVINTTTGKLTQGATVYDVSTEATTLSFGGLALEDELRNSTVANVTTGVNVSVAGTAATAVTLIGGDGADTLTGGAGDDNFVGGKGNDTLNGGNAVGETQSFTISSGFLGGDDGYRLSNGGDFIEVTGSGGTNASAIVAGASFIKLGAAVVDEDSIGAALDAVSNADLATALVVGPIASTSYDAATNVFTIQFAPGSNPITSATSQVDNAGGKDPATTIVGSAVTVTNDGGITAGSDDFYFEAKAADNGLDTISGFSNGGAGQDRLIAGTGGGANFDQLSFLGAAAVYDGDLEEDGAAEDMFLTAGENVGVFYNHAPLTAANIKTAATNTAAFGEVILLDNAKAMILTSTDVDGAADGSQQAWNVYFVEDTDATAAQNFVVTQVATLTGVTEIAATSWSGASFA